MQLTIFNSNFTIELSLSINTGPYKIENFIRSNYGIESKEPQIGQTK